MSLVREGPEVRFKLSIEDYRYLEGLAKFYYDNEVISTPSVHSLAKLGTIKLANDWIEQQNRALEIRKQRKEVSKKYAGVGNQQQEQPQQRNYGKPVIPPRPVQPAANIDEEYNELYAAQLEIDKEEEELL